MLVAVREDSRQFLHLFNKWPSFFIVLLQQNTCTMNKQLQLTYEKGIANVPSDAICDDNMLEDSVGMVYDNGEHRPIQAPSPKVSGCNGILMFIHKPNSTTENYLYIKEVEGISYLMWGQEINGVMVEKDALESGIVREETQLTAIGKTLIVNKPSGLTYYTWKGTEYNQLASNIPDVDIDFRLIIPDGGGTHTEETGDISEFFDEHWRSHVKYGEQESWNNTVIGIYNKCKNYIAKEKKGFVGPFFIRAAVKMYDGSYTKLTPPILIIPSMLDNHYGTYNDQDGILHMTMFYRALKYKLNTDYSDYRDLVSSIVVFVSDQVETHNTNQSEYGSMLDMAYATWDENVEHVCIRKSDNSLNPQDEDSYFVARYSNVVTIASPCVDKEGNEGYNPDFPYLLASGFRVLDRRTKNDINKDLQEISVFYKLFETEDIFREPNVDPDWRDASSDIRDGVMENIRTQEQLPDEYYGHTERSGSYAYVYNSRLNLANVQRTFFKGFRKFMPYDWYLYNTDTDAITKYYEIYVDVETDGGHVIVKDAFTSSERFGLWFYYPDPRAKRVRIFQRAIDGGPLMLFLDENLKEHTGLNGAYYFDGLPFESEFNKLLELADIPTESTELTETLNNTIITSDVNNPYIFNASGYKQAGDGTILAVTTNTQALSQGQFGQFPLMIFTDKGIWAMELDNTGLFISSKPTSREVCNNPASITQTDGAVFFSSEKGLMCIVGNDVRLVSPQLKSDFIKFLGDSQTFIAYDYRDSLLWIANPTSTFMWIYNIKDGTFSKYSLSGARTSVSDYPDTLIQTQDSCIFSLLKRPQQEDDENTYSGIMETRPMKFGDGMSLKSIMQLKNVYQMEGDVSLRIYASNDMNNWRELHSLRNSPWKYYKFRFDFDNMKATDRFAGTQLVFQERRTNKLR